MIKARTGIAFSRRDGTRLRGWVTANYYSSHGHGPVVYFAASFFLDLLLLGLIPKRRWTFERNRDLISYDNSYWCHAVPRIFRSRYGRPVNFMAIEHKSLGADSAWTIFSAVGTVGTWKWGLESCLETQTLIPSLPSWAAAPWTVVQMEDGQYHKWFLIASMWSFIEN